MCEPPFRTTCTCRKNFCSQSKHSNFVICWSHNESHFYKKHSTFVIFLHGILTSMKETTMESLESWIERDSIFSARETIRSFHNIVTNRRVFPQCHFSEKCKKLEQKSNSESQNNQPIIEFLQSNATSDIGRVDMQVTNDFVSSGNSANSLRKFKPEFPNLSESTVQTFKKEILRKSEKM